MTSSATGSRAKGGDTHQQSVGFQDQRTTGITLTGGDTAGGGDANVGSTDQGTKGAGAHSVGDDGHASPLQMSGNTTIVGHSTPAGGNTSVTGIGGMRAGSGGNSDQLNSGGQGGVRDADQGNIVDQSVAVIAGMIDDVGGADTVRDLRAGASGGTQLHQDGADSVMREKNGFRFFQIVQNKSQIFLPNGTVSSRQDPGITNQGTTAPGGTSAGQGQRKSHLIGELTGGGSLTIGNALLILTNHGHDLAASIHLLSGHDHFTRIDHLLLNGEGRGGGQSQSKNNQKLHLITEK